ncbi:DUF6894 family protein [Methylobacterium radiotolerans]|uniref:DUF6894 family protein n=1 Tax=Methylobacterium radiotolerans TaxID=31998 RepID=UPI0038D09C5B
MPRYFIDYEEGAKRLVDEEGTEYPDLTAARDAAIAALPDIGRDAPPSDGKRRFVASIRDAQGRMLCTVTLKLDADCDPGPPGGSGRQD